MTEKWLSDTLHGSIPHLIPREITTFQERNISSSEQYLQRGRVMVHKSTAHDGSLSITISKNDHTRNLNEYLPTDWTITESARILNSPCYCDPNSKSIVVGNPLQRTASRPFQILRPYANAKIGGDESSGELLRYEFFLMGGAMLLTLHEIGHANYYESNPEAWEREVNHRSTRAEVEPGEQKEFIQPVMQSEAFAWKYALQQCKELEAEGLPVEENLTQKDKVHLVKSYLTTYKSLYNAKAKEENIKRILSLLQDS